MPTRAGSWCPSCQRDRDQERGSASARGLGYRWQKLQRSVLAEWRADHGDLCPGWRRAPHAASDLTVDHIVARDVDPSLAYERSNLQVLCRSCNSAKGARPA
jgi:5-methylcytosine-specific restriction enzyme A